MGLWSCLLESGSAVRHLTEVLGVLVQTSQPEAPARRTCVFHQTACSLLSPQQTCPSPDYYFYMRLSFRSTHFVQPLTTVL